jgi:hypothetical protein
MRGIDDGSDESRGNGMVVGNGDGSDECNGMGNVRSNVSG